MKVNELMVGDWVKVVDHFEPWLESLYVRVQGLDDTLRPLIETEYQLKGRKAWASIKYEPEHIEPIPLTEEILKANGFTESTSRNGWSCLSYTPCTSCQPMMPLIDLVKFDDKWHVSSHDCKPFNVNGMVQYVHELQHALRLCGLNELADNFKIK